MQRWLLNTKRFWYSRRQQSPEVKSWLHTPLPNLKNDVRDTHFLVIDLEMTGLDTQKDNIVSIGWVCVNGGAVDLATARHLLLQQPQSVGQSATIHQIRDSDLRKGVSEPEAIRELLKVSAGKVLVFHHASVDLAFLHRAFRRYFGVPCLLPVVDTLDIEKSNFDRSNQPIPTGALRLGACRRRYSLPNYPAHNALVDAIATAELLLAIIARKRRGGDYQLREL